MTRLSVGQIFKGKRGQLSSGWEYEIEIVAIEPGLVKFISNNTDLDKDYFLFGMTDFFRDGIVYSSRYRTLVRAIENGFWILDTSASLENINLYIDLGFIKNDSEEPQTV